MSSRNRGGAMELLLFVGFLALWVAWQVWILPKVGVPT